MTLSVELHLKDFHYKDLFYSEGLKKLDTRFLSYLQNENPLLYKTLLSYRQNASVLLPETISELVIEVAPILETFLAELFRIEEQVISARLKAKKQDPVFAFKAWYVLREAKRKLKEADHYPTFQALDRQVNAMLADTAMEEDRELAIAKMGVAYLQEPAAHEQEIQVLIQWCVKAMTDPLGKQKVQSWVSFRLPERLDDQHLIPLKSAESDNSLGRLRADFETFRFREGFNLTDHRMSSEEVLSEAHYCIYCHTHQGDFCASGFPVKKAQPELGLKSNTLGKIMTGCPLDEKVSEMNFLKKSGYTIAPLAVVMIDNPMCPVTGHRICNDCMKACIYQKQTPVDIPQVETAVLTDVLNLPWGVEIYDLLTRWNPLRNQQVMMKPFNGYKVLIAGMGPAGFSMAHYLTMEGCGVVGVDGLKIEPLNPDWIHQPIRDWSALQEPLEDRQVAGFGGVAEYGITVRWDKNFLKLIYLSLMRRQPYFKVFGNVRFGGTLTVEDAFALGFDHLVVAVGAGLPQAISIPNSLAPGMRQANDFLMTLQLMGAAKQESLTHLQIRMPIVVIGGGLTAVDTATEAQAYYIRQVEKLLFYYEVLASAQGESLIRAHFEASEEKILDEFLTHARQIRAEKKQAQAEGRKPNLLSLIEQWGGVTLVYRRTIQDSPAYRFNHEELKKALEEGIYYLENLEPASVLLDDAGQCESLVCHMKVKDEHGAWVETHEEKRLPARAILVATGSKPNIAYEFEHRGTFRRSGHFYDGFILESGSLKEAEVMPHVKSPQPGMLTSYHQDNRYVSFLGDAHPVFQGSVVKAIASSLRAYPDIMKALEERSPDLSTYTPFAEEISQLFSAEVVLVKRHISNMLEICVRAPKVCQNFRPGEFYRLQPYETSYSKPNSAIEPIAVLGMSVDKLKGEVSLLIWDAGVNAQWLNHLKSGDPIAIMGPTGVRIKIPKDQETVLILGEEQSIPLILALGKAMREAGNRVLYIGCFKQTPEPELVEKVVKVTDQVIWILKKGEPIQANRDQDVSLDGDFIPALLHYVQTETLSRIPLAAVNRIIIRGSLEFLCAFKKAHHAELKGVWHSSVKLIASVYGPMQCMLKGICAQCLQWQLDPETGERTKAVFACSWQDQPMELIDLEHLSQRMNQNAVQAKLYKLWGKMRSTDLS